MKSSWRSPDGGSSVARNTKIEPCGAVFCAWWGTGSTPIRSFHTVSLRASVKAQDVERTEAIDGQRTRHRLKSEVRFRDRLLQRRRPAGAGFQARHRRRGYLR